MDLNVENFVRFLSTVRTVPRDHANEPPNSILLIKCGTSRDLALVTLPHFRSGDKLRLQRSTYSFMYPTKETERETVMVYKCSCDQAPCRMTPRVSELEDRERMPAVLHIATLMDGTTDLDNLPSVFQIMLR